MHAGFEFLYVLAGELIVRHGDQEATLGAGDAVYFDSGTPHSYRCAGAKPAEALIVTIHMRPRPSRSPCARPPAQPRALFQRLRRCGPVSLTESRAERRRNSASSAPEASLSVTQVVIAELPVTLPRSHSWTHPKADLRHEA